MTRENNTGPSNAISRPIEKREAEKLLAKAVEYVRAGDFKGLCSAVALSDQSCMSEVYSAEQAGWRPTADTPGIVGSEDIPPKSANESPVLVLKLSGLRADGSRYQADFATMRSGYSTPGDIKVVTPIYWSGVTYRSD